MGRQIKKEYLNAEKTIYKSKSKGDDNCNKLVITPKGITEIVCYSFDKNGKQTSHSEGRITGNYDLEKLQISPTLKPFTKKEKNKVVIDLPKGKYMRLESVEYTQGLVWNQMGTLEVSKDPKNIHMSRQQAPTELKVIAQNKPILGNYFDQLEAKKRKK